MTYVSEEHEESPEENVYSTRDLTLAATLMTLKFPMKGIDYQIVGSKNNPVGYFKFEDTTELEEARMKFMQALLSVEPKAFMTNVHSLKAEVVGAFNNPHKKLF